MSSYYYPEERIAVVAMGGYFPDAENLNAFWSNILKKKVSIRDLPEDILDPRIYYRPDLFEKSEKKDKTYTKIGAVAKLDNYFPICKKFKIPPSVAEHMDPNQLMAIYCVDQALQSLRSVLPKERTAVIFGTGAQGMRYESAVKRIFFQKTEDYLRNQASIGFGVKPSEIDELISGLSGEVLKNTIPITEDTAPGTLQSITASRITNVFDFYGPSFTVDAACASSLAAAALGITGLLNHEYDAVITGGVEATLGEIGHIVFSGINALSPDGSFPFDERANGFVIGLGGGVIILKRLQDAIRDNDRIIALLSGSGMGSDGKGKSIAAPSEEGQVRVIQDAYKMAGYPVDTVELIEAHGTGTIVGDVVEINALKKGFLGLGATRQNYCGLSSVKSNIGHLRYASGAASLIKTALALQNKILPPTASVKKVNPKLQLEGSPFYILTEQKNWQEANGHPRRAGVSAYGFGGADFHVAMEEYRPEFFKKIYHLSKAEKVAATFSDYGRNQLCQEVVHFSGNSFEEVSKAYSEFAENYKSKTEFEKAVFLHNSAVSAKRTWRLAICAQNLEELKEKWEQFSGLVKGDKGGSAEALSIKGIFLGKGETVTPDQMAWMFPGQASQYPNMLKGIYESFSSAETVWVQGDTYWSAKYGYPISPLVFGNDEEQLEKELKDTKNTHPAMFLSNTAMFKLLSESGVRAEYMIGHSLGEITALYAGGVLDFKTAMELIGSRGFSFDAVPESERGGMVSVKADKRKVDEMVENGGFGVSIANINSPEQTVVGGTVHEIDEFAEFLNQNKVVNTILKVSHGFHTNLTAGAAEAFYSEIAHLKFDKPKSKVMACHLVDFYPEEKDQMRDMAGILKNQIISPVNFVDSVLKLYEKGVRVFIEAGPSSVLSNLVKGILQDKDTKVITTNIRKKDSVEAYKRALGELFACGIEVCAVPMKNTLPAEKTLEVESDTHRTPETGTQVSVQSVQAQGPSLQKPKESLVYSGVSMGLPGTYKKVFSDDNFRLLLEGKNLIEMLTDEEMESMLDLNITRLIKTEEGAVYKRLSAVNEVVQLAGKLGKIEMLDDYLLDEKTLKQMTFTVCAGIAAGYEALKDAGIPLVREQIKTSSGHYLPGRYVLPKEMQEDTGVIFANEFLSIEPFIEEVSKYIANKFGAKTRTDLIRFYEDVITRVSDLSTRKMLSDWFALHYSRISSNSGEEDIYKFNHEFLAQTALGANNRLAQFISAYGPNFHISAACSSTASGVTMAEDLIRGGHASRMIIVGVEAPSSKVSLPWLGASFLSIGAANNASDVFEAAVPFDNRRKGMILGAGAVGLVIEKEYDVAKRGMNGICRILGTHIFNTAGHQVRIDNGRFCIELDKFITKMENEYKLDRKELASNTVYSSHETYSPKKGGCSSAEKAAIQNTFGDRFRDMKVINTKGMTGHTLGASIEEAVAAKALQYQKIPPVVNYREPDPELEGLNLSKGGTYNFEYVLRMVAGYGGQGNYHLLQRIAQGDERVCDRKAYQDWLERITSSKSVALENHGRILVAEGGGQDSGKRLEDSATHGLPAKLDAAVERKMPVQENANKTLASEKGGAVNQDITEQILDIYSEVTKYPKEMLDLSMELEADLGVDTVKQATIFSMISERFHMEWEGGLKLSDYPAIGQVIDLISELTAWQNPERKDDTAGGITDKAAVDYSNEIFGIISEITKYPVDMLERDMEMEADLGIDTVKQATIFSILGEKFGIGEKAAVNISQYKTIDSVIEFVHNTQKSDTVKNNVNAQVQNHPVGNVRPEHKEAQTLVKNVPVINASGNVDTQVLAIISEITKYPVDMLEKDMEMEADLGIDTVKQATIFSMLGEKFGIPQDEVTNISSYRTIGDAINMVEEIMKKNAGGMRVEKASPAQGNEDIMVDGAEVPEENRVERELSLQIPVFIEKDLGSQDFDLRDKNIWVLGSREKTVQDALKHYKKYSHNVQGFIFEGSMPVSELEAKAHTFVQSPVDVIIDCTHIGAEIEFDTISKDDEHKMLFLSSEARFIFYKKLSETLQEPEIRTVCAISMDGCHGYNTSGQSIKDPFFGALSGFYKGLRKEWTKSKVKIVDLGPMQTPGMSDEALFRISGELQAESLDYEIGYADGKRAVLKIDYLDRSEYENTGIPEGAHFLITGGGYGITAEIIMELSRSFKPRFTVFGRTTLPDNIDELASLSEQAMEEKKAEIYNLLKVSGRKVTPLMVQNEYDKLVKAVSIHRLVEGVKKSGGELFYVPCDVRNYEDMKEALQKAVERFGPVHVLVHAAGVEKSRLIQQKTRKEFNEVFSVKAEGLCNIFRLVDRENLKAIIGFSSISGRFGNEAQLDYCAANSFINSFMAVIKSMHPEIYALSVVWSGWKDTGIAWRNEFIRTHSEGLGTHLIECKRGSEAFAQVLTHGIPVHEIIISKGLQHFIHQSMLASQRSKAPLVDWFSKKDGRLDKAYKIFSVKRDQIFDHHRLGVTPLVPAVAFMEICAEVHGVNCGRKEHYCFRDIKLNNPLKLYNEHPREVIMSIHEGVLPESFEVTSYACLDSKFGISKQVELNSIQVSSLLGDYTPLLEIRDIEKEDMEQGFTKHELEEMHKALSNTIQLGPLFMDKEKESNIHYRNKNGAVYSVKLPEQQLNNPKYPLDELLVNPAFMDSLFQICGIHATFENQRIFLPWRVEEFGVVKVPREPGVYRSYAKMKNHSDELKTYDVIMLNVKDELCYYAKNVVMRRISL